MITNSKELSADELDKQSAIIHKHVLSKKGFLVESILGKGSFSIIKKALYIEQNEYVAVKIISKQKCPSGYRDKFLTRELSIIKVVKHPNIIKYTKIIETSKHVYIIMELALQDLLDLIRKERSVNEERACRWFHQLTDAIDYCHQRGIAHRDIKCENLLLDKNDILKVTDFGFAKEFPVDWENDGIDGASSTFCGSWAYACPEILQKIPYQAPLSDIWSMGIVLFVMVYGKFPFDISNRQIFLTMAKEGMVQFRECSKISNSCKDIILKILKPEKERIRMADLKNHYWFCNFYNRDWIDHVHRSKTIITQISENELHQNSNHKPKKWWQCI